MQIRLSFDKVSERTAIKKIELLKQFKEILKDHLEYKSFRSLNRALDENHENKKGVCKYAVLPRNSDWYFKEVSGQITLDYTPLVRPLQLDEVRRIGDKDWNFYKYDRQNQVTLFSRRKIEDNTPFALLELVSKEIDDLEKSVNESNARFYKYQLQDMIEKQFSGELTAKDFEEQKNLTARMLEEASREIRKLRWTLDIQRLNFSGED